MVHRCCFYGILRKGEPGWVRILNLYGGDSLQHVKTLSLPGFELYGFNKFSGAVCCRGSKDSRVIFDMCRIMSDKCFERIVEFELVNYHIVHDLISIDDVFYSIFTYKIRPENTTRILSGDWLEKNFKHERYYQEDFTGHIDPYD